MHKIIKLLRERGAFIYICPMLPNQANGFGRVGWMAGWLLFMHTIYEVLKDDYIQTMVLDFPLISFGGVYTYIDYT